MLKTFTVMKKREVVWIFMLSVCLILMAMPRFDRREFREKVLQSKGAIPISMLGDSPKYIALTEYFRSDLEDRSLLKAPFTYRLMVPFMASFLPFQAITLSLIHI